MFQVRNGNSAEVLIIIGFAEKWPDAKILMCYYHVSVKVDEFSKKFFKTAETQKRLKEDFSFL